MRLSIMPCAALLTLASTSAWAASDWVEVTRNHKETAIIFVDRSSIKRDGVLIRYWQRREYLSNPDGWAQSLELRETSCSTTQDRLLHYTVHFKDGRISRHSISDTTWDYIDPDSVAMGVHEFLCGK